MLLTLGGPPWVDFFLFLATHMRNDRVSAIVDATMVRFNDYVLELIARAIVAAEGGRAERAVEVVRHIIAVEPIMSRDLRDRFFPRDMISDQLIEGLRRACLGSGG